MIRAIVLMSVLTMLCYGYRTRWPRIWTIGSDLCELISSRDSPVDRHEPAKFTF